MDTLGEVERAVWKQIQQAMANRESARLATLGSIAEEMEKMRKDWIGRMSNRSGSPEQARVSSEREDFTGRSIRGFTLSGTQFWVNTYKDLLLRLANQLRTKHGAAFDEHALSLGGRKRRYFSRSPRTLKYPAELDGGQLFAETNLNANLIIKICRDMLRGLGYGPTSLTFVF